MHGSSSTAQQRYGGECSFTKIGNNTTTSNSLGNLYELFQRVYRDREYSSKAFAREHRTPFGKLFFQMFF